MKDNRIRGVVTVAMAAGALLAAPMVSARADSPSNNAPAAGGAAGAATTAGMAATTAGTTTAGTAAGAQARAQVGSVLLFPAGFAGDGMAAAAPAAAGAARTLSPAQQQLQESLTDAFRRSLSRAGVNVTVYNRRLPSIQRAVTETAITADIAAEGLRDTSDTARAQRLADIVGADAYIVPTVSDYRFDAATRAVSFNLDVAYQSTRTGTSLGAAAVPGRAEAPAGVANSLLEGSASARAAEAAVERVVNDLFPRPAAAENGGNKPAAQQRPRRSRTSDFLLPAFGGLLAFVLLSND